MRSKPETLNMIRNAGPSRLPTGTNPHTRLSMLWWRLSPSTNRWPLGISQASSERNATNCRVSQPRSRFAIGCSAFWIRRRDRRTAYQPSPGISS